LVVVHDLKVRSSGVFARCRPDGAASGALQEIPDDYLLARATGKIGLAFRRLANELHWLRPTLTPAANMMSIHQGKTMPYGHGQNCPCTWCLSDVEERWRIVDL
jgi:hypothetical protein